MRRTRFLLVVGLMVAGLSLIGGPAGPATAALTPPPTFPVARTDCDHGDWADWHALDFASERQCVAWVEKYILAVRCRPLVLADFQPDAPRYADQVGLTLGTFIAAVCHGSRYPVSNASYVVDDPAGTELLSFESRHTVPYVSDPDYIYEVWVTSTWWDGPTRLVDAAYTSDDGGLTWSTGPGDGRNLETQIDETFVNWGRIRTTTHVYSTWVRGTGDPITMRVFEGDPATGVVDPAGYADNVGFRGGDSVSTIVYGYEFR